MLKFLNEKNNDSNNIHNIHNDILENRKHILLVIKGMHAYLKVSISYIYIS